MNKHQTDEFISCCQFLLPCFSIFATCGCTHIRSANNEGVELDETAPVLLLVAEEHSGVSCEAAAFSPNGERIVIASTNRIGFQIYDTESGKMLHTLEQSFRGHRGQSHSVMSVDYSPDGKTIVTANSDHTPRIWDAESGKVLHYLQGHTNNVCSAAFSPNGKTIVTGSWDKTVRIWDAESGKELRQLEGHDGFVNSVAFSPDGKKIASAGSDIIIRIWDAESGKELISWKGHERIWDGINFVAFSPDGTKIVSTGNDYTAKIWDTESGKELLKLERTVRRDTPPSIRSALFSQDGKKIVTTDRSKDARIWDAESGKEILMLTGHKYSVYSAAFSTDGTKLVTTGDHEARIWDWTMIEKQYAEINNLPPFIELEGPFISTFFSPDGTKVVTAGNKAKNIQIWDPESGEELLNWEVPTQAVSVAFSPDGTKIVSASGGFTRSVNIAQIWDAETGKELQVMRGHTDYVYSVRFSPDGKQIITASYDGTARIWNIESGKELKRLSRNGLLPRRRSDVSYAVFSPDGKTIAAKYTESRDDILNQTSARVGIVRLFDAESGKELRKLEGQQIGLSFHHMTVGPVAFSPDGKQIVTGSNVVTEMKGSSVVTTIGIVQIWDVETGKELKTLKQQRLVGQSETASRLNFVHSAVFSPDGKKIFTGSGDGTVRIWDVESGTELRKWKGHSAGVSSAVVVSPDGRKVISQSSGDKTARIWSLE